MEKEYNHKKIEDRINRIWGENNYFTPKIDPAKKPFSIFLTPPNASGGMHIGNVLMIAIQDILARYHRAKGEPTLWIPSTDHGGYETQVTFEKEFEKNGEGEWYHSNKELYKGIKKFVENNNTTIKNQIKALGASVDWSRFRYTMDEDSLESTNETFKKMVSDNLVYRRSYMTNYCPSCSTILADIELKESKEKSTLYFIKFNFQESDDFLTLVTTRPEFLFSVTHVLIHPLDQRYVNHIGKTLINPTTGKEVKIIASKRKFDPEKLEPFLSPFFPSYKKYDYEYTLRNSLPVQNLLDWSGKMIFRYPGLKPSEARIKEITFLREHGCIEKVDEEYIEPVFYCKKGHTVESVIMLTWFLKMDDEKNPLRQPALEAIKKGSLSIIPKWKEKGLIEWMEKMHDWPIARQNVWGIKIPIWYDVSDPAEFTVWFIDKKGRKLYGNLKIFLENGFSLEDVTEGLERIQASKDVAWTLEKEEGKYYLPETDTFDTWFSSGQWGSIVFGKENSDDFSYFYPSDSIVIGVDLLRLSVSRKILLSLYLTGKLPFKKVYLHRLIKGEDGQKMSKSLGNAVSLEYYLKNYGADVTRMALISHTSLRDDFIFSEEQLLHFHNFSSRLWDIGRFIKENNNQSLSLFKQQDLSREDNHLLIEIDRLTFFTGSSLDKYLFANSQERLCNFLSILEKYIQEIHTRKNIEIPLSILRYAYKKYLTILHPFMPFMTEELHNELFNSICPLSSNPWPDKMNYFGE